MHSFTTEVMLLPPYTFTFKVLVYKYDKTWFELLDLISLSSFKFKPKSYRLIKHFRSVIFLLFSKLVR